MLTYTYDNLDRMIVKTVPERSGLTAAQTRDVYYGYDLRNLQLFARFDSPSGEGIANVYDGFGRLASSTTTMGGTSRTLSYQYDSNGNRTRITHPDGAFFSSLYDRLGRMYGLIESDYFWLGGFSFDDRGLVSLQSYEGFAAGYSSYGHDGIGRLNALTHDLYGTARDVAFAFGRNPAGQIVSAQRDNDAFAWAGHYQVSRLYTTNGLNQYSAAGGAATCASRRSTWIWPGTATLDLDKSITVPPIMLRRELRRQCTNLWRPRLFAPQDASMTAAR